MPVGRPDDGTACMACSRRDTSASAGRVVSCLAANTLVGNLQRPVDFVQASSTRLLLHPSQQGTSLSACNSIATAFSCGLNAFAFRTAFVE